MKACEEGQLFFAEWKIDGHILSLLLSSPLKSLTIFSLLLVIGEADSSPLRSIFCSICSRLWAEMEFEDQEEHEEEEMEMAAASYDSLGNSGPRVKMPSTEQPAQRKPRYRECLKNHAVGLGGHALDGCGEFLAAGAEGTLDALKCAACNCHRNFHRKESDAVNAGVGVGEPFLLPHHPHPQFSPYYRTPAGYLHVAPHHRPLALPSTSGGGGTHSREDQEDMSNPSGGGGGSSLGKKRFRTKFTQEQKDRMLGLAETLGWRIQKHDEAVVQQFCNETGVKRHVLKVWMHNNKHTLGKKP